MSFWDITSLLIVIFAICYLGYQTFLWIERRTSAKYVTQEELIAAGRSIQLIDVREAGDFNNKHILGARNLPYTQLKQSMSGLRKDQAIYLYDDFGFMAGRAAGKLKRAGYTNIYMLKGGLDRWTGKTKSNRKEKKED